MKATGPMDSNTLVLGQGPGEDEAYSGIPFVGRAGRQLNSWLRRAGYERMAIRISNIVWCQLPGDRAPKRDEVAHCRAAHWQPDLDAMPNLRVIIPVGVPAMKVFYGPKAGERTAGQVMELQP